MSAHRAFNARGSVLSFRRLARCPRLSAKAGNVAVTAMIAALGGCDDGPNANYMMDPRAGVSAATIHTDQGTMVGRSGPSVPVKMSAGFTIYPGAKVLSNTITSRDGNDGGIVTMASADSPREIAKFYADQARSNGLTVSVELDTAHASMVAGEGENGMVFSFNASEPEADGYRGNGVWDETELRKRGRAPNTGEDHADVALRGRGEYVPDEASGALGRSSRAGNTRAQLMIGYKAEAAR